MGAAAGSPCLSCEAASKRDCCAHPRAAETSEAGEREVRAEVDLPLAQVAARGESWRLQQRLARGSSWSGEVIAEGNAFDDDYYDIGHVSLSVPVDALKTYDSEDIVRRDDMPRRRSTIITPSHERAKAFNIIPSPASSTGMYRAVTDGTTPPVDLDLHASLPAGWESEARSTDGAMVMKVVSSTGSQGSASKRLYESCPPDSTRARRMGASSTDRSLTPHLVLSACPDEAKIRFIRDKEMAGLVVPWPRYQELETHPSAFIEPDSQDLVIAVSHAWNYQTHPDPLGEKAPVLTDLIRKATEEIRPTGRTLVFVDFLSIAQRPFAAGQQQRSEDEELAFTAALRAMPSIYLYADAVVLLDMPKPAKVPGEDEIVSISTAPLLQHAVLRQVGDVVQVVGWRSEKDKPKSKAKEATKAGSSAGQARRLRGSRTAVIFEDEIFKGKKGKKLSDAVLSHASAAHVSDGEHARRDSKKETSSSTSSDDGNAANRPALAVPTAAESTVAPFDILVDLDGKPPWSTEQALKNLAKRPDDRPKVASIRKAPFGKRNNTPAAQRGWIYLEWFIAMVKVAMTSAEDDPSNMVFTNDPELKKRIMNAGAVLREAATHGDPSRLGKALSFHLKVLNEQRFTSVSTDRLENNAQPGAQGPVGNMSDNEVVCVIMAEMIQYLERHWAEEVAILRRRKLVRALGRLKVISNLKAGVLGFRRRSTETLAFTSTEM